MFIKLRDHSHTFEGVTFFSNEQYDKFWFLMKKLYNEGRQNDTHLMGCITYRRSLEENASLYDDVATTLNHAIYESMKEDGPQNTLFRVTFQNDEPLLEHRKGYNIQKMKAVAPMVISHVEDGALVELVRDESGNALYLHSNNFDGHHYEKAMRKALELFYDRYGTSVSAIPFSVNMPRLIDDVDKDTPEHYIVNRVKYMVRDDHIALCVPYSETMVAVAELANCTPFRFDDELLIVNIFSPSQAEAKCLYDNLQAFRKFKEEMKKWQ